MSVIFKINPGPPLQQAPQSSHQGEFSLYFTLPRSSSTLFECLYNHSSTPSIWWRPCNCLVLDSPHGSSWHGWILIVQRKNRDPLRILASDFYCTAVRTTKKHTYPECTATVKFRQKRKRERTTNTDNLAVLILKEEESMGR